MATDIFDGFVFYFTDSSIVDEFQIEIEEQGGFVSSSFNKRVCVLFNLNIIYISKVYLFIGHSCGY